MDKTGLHKKAMLVALESNLGNVTEACKEADLHIIFGLMKMKIIKSK
jgi:hypothetical protein